MLRMFPPRPRLLFLHQMPLRLILVVPFVIQVSVAVGLTGWLSLHNGQRAINDLALQLRHETTQQIDHQISNFLTDARTLNELTVKAIQRDQIDLREIRALEKLYWSYLTSFDTISGLGAGNAAGDIMALFQQVDADDTRYFLEYSNAETSGQYLSLQLNDQGDPIHSTRFDQVIDARTRPWYQAALTAKKSIWTGVYPSIGKYTDHALLINLSTPIQDGSGGVQGVVSVILDLRTISRFLEDLELSPSTQVYILQPDGALIGSSDGQNPLDVVNGEVVQRQAIHSDTPLIRESATYLSQQFTSLNDIRQPQQLEFWLEGQRQFLQITPLTLEDGVNWLSVVVVPEADFMTQIQANTRNTALLCLAALGIAIALGLVTSRWITAPLLRLSKAARAIATGDLNQTVDRRGSREIRDLAAAFNHMVRQLQTLFLDVQTSERRYRQVVESQTDFILRSLPDTTITFANETLCLALGCPMEEVVGQKWIDFADPEDLEQTLRRIDALTPAQPVFPAENRDTRANGQVGWTQWINQGIFNEQGELIEIQSVGRDITALKQTEAALRESEERFRRAITEAPFPIIIHAEDGEVLQVNQTWVELTGYAHTEIPTIADWTQKAYGERQEVLRGNIEQLYSLNTRVDEGEFQIHTRMGEVRIWDFCSTPLGSLSDGRRLVMSIAADVTQRKQIEDELRRSRDQIADILESITDAFIAIDRHWRFTYLNHRAEQILRRSQQDLIGRVLWEEFPDAIGTDFDREYHRVLQDQVSTVFETFYPPLHTWFEVHAYPNPDGLTVYFQDITVRKQSEAALQQTNQELERRVAHRTAQLHQTNSRLSLALQAANAGTWEWDMVNNQAFWSDENYRLLGYEPDSCDSSYENWLRAVYPGDREYVHTCILQVINQRLPLNLEYRVLLPTGQIRWISDLGEVVYDDQGQPRSMAGLRVDITQRKQAEEQLRLSSERISLANAELARAARLKDEFLAGMSHELRTPLNSVLGLSEALLDHTFGELNQQQEEFLEIIQQSGRHLLALINDILDLSKVQSGKMDLQIAAVPIHDLCDMSLSFVKQQAHQKHISLTCDVTQDILEIEVDERRIRQVLINLLNNAVKFTPNGGSVTLQVTRNFLQEAVEFKVIDTGIGISSEKMDRLFQPFVQLDSGLSRRYEGTGLGLALVKQITELHGGSIGLESTVGQGSCFTVTLPLNAHYLKHWPSGSPPVNAAPSISENSPLDRLLTPLSLDQSLWILLAEDHEANVMMMVEYLQHHKMQVMVARNGLEAICLAEQQSVDLILMDIQMPEMDGLTAIRKIRQMTNYAHTPIIALTALAMPGDCDRCLEAGATAYLTKPISLKHLTALIRTSAARFHGD
ncbi:MAG: PAS domain S-box protein [Synechococcales bacterium]|nr:PAS domain S-box protein [Synechococcales bacterium]